MDLPTYIRRTGMTVADLARELGFPHEIVRLWVRGDRRPKPENVNRIIEATGGKVTRSGLRPDLYPPRKRAA